MGWRGRLKIDGRGKQNVLRISKTAPAADRSSVFDSLSVSTSREGAIVYIKVTGWQSRDELEQAMKSTTDMNLDISLAARPTALDIQWRDGQLTLLSLAMPVSIAAGELSLKATDISRKLTVRATRLEGSANQLTGGLDASYQFGNFQVTGLSGESKVNAHAGDVTIQQSLGNLQLITHEGTLRLTKANGALDLESGRGTIVVSGQSGSVRGRIDDGSVTLELVDDVDVQLQSNKANVAVKTPVASGASVRVSADGAAVTVPETIRLQSAASGTLRVYSGRLAGTQAKGSIDIQSKEGTVRIR